jgi:hypothetical protein
MLPGPTIILACPFCGQYAKKKTLISYNTFGAQLWSDGKNIAPMKPEFPSLVICKKCNQFFWIKDAKKVDEVTNSTELKEKYGDIEFIEFPTFHQYFKALESIDDEKFIRINIWWSFNDYFRNSNENEITPATDRLNTENLTALLKILDETDKNEILMKVEVLRNLMQFDASFKLLNRMNDANFDWVKEKLLAEIYNLNNKVIQLR